MSTPRRSDYFFIIYYYYYSQNNNYTQSVSSSHDNFQIRRFSTTPQTTRHVDLKIQEHKLDTYSVFHSEKPFFFFNFLNNIFCEASQAYEVEKKSAV